MVTSGVSVVRVRFDDCLARFDECTDRTGVRRRIWVVFRTTVEKTVGINLDLLVLIGSLEPKVKMKLS